MLSDRELLLGRWAESIQRTDYIEEKGLLFNVN